VAGVTVPEDAKGTRPNAKRIAQYVDERSAMAEKALQLTLTNDIDLMGPEEFDTALEAGISEYGMLQRKDGRIKSML
jgi:hypothetical protein